MKLKLFLTTFMVFISLSTDARNFSGGGGIISGEPAQISIYKSCVLKFIAPMPLKLGSIEFYYEKATNTHTVRINNTYNSTNYFYATEKTELRFTGSGEIHQLYRYADTPNLPILAIVDLSSDKKFLTSFEDNLYSARILNCQNFASTEW